MRRVPTTLTLMNSQHIEQDANCQVAEVTQPLHDLLTPPARRGYPTFSDSQDLCSTLLGDHGSDGDSQLDTTQSNLGVCRIADDDDGILTDNDETTIVDDMSTATIQGSQPSFVQNPGE